MRIKDETKKQAIDLAVIQLINEIGYANISMSKIAKVAGVSAATLYTYYENKEEMFKEVYSEAKKEMLKACYEGLTSENSVKQSVFQFCKNILSYAQNNEAKLLFIHQSSGSTLIQSAIDSEVEALVQQTALIFERGIKEGLLKPVSPLLLISFCVYPINELYIEQCQSAEAQATLDFEMVFQMCWDAIRK
jgi:Transcriptional regulator